jgi:hypothetical protein
VRVERREHPLNGCLARLLVINLVGVVRGDYLQRLCEGRFDVLDIAFPAAEAANAADEGGGCDDGDGCDAYEILAAHNIAPINPAREENSLRKA